jgi:hypothetical protein
LLVGAVAEGFSTVLSHRLKGLRKLADTAVALTGHRRGRDAKIPPDDGNSDRLDVLLLGCPDPSGFTLDPWYLSMNTPARSDPPFLNALARTELPDCVELITTLEPKNGALVLPGDWISI